MANAVFVFDVQAKTVRQTTSDRPEQLTDFEFVHHDNILPEELRSVTDKLTSKSTLAPPGGHQEDLQDLARRTGDVSVYMYYYKSIGPRRAFCALGIITAYIIASNFPRYLIQWYTDDTQSRFATFLIVYFMLVIIASLSQGAIIW